MLSPQAFFFCCIVWWWWCCCLCHAGSCAVSCASSVRWTQAQVSDCPLTEVRRPHALTLYIYTHEPISNIALIFNVAVFLYITGCISEDVVEDIKGASFIVSIVSYVSCCSNCVFVILCLARTCFVSDLNRGLKIQEAKFNMDGSAEVRGLQVKSVSIIQSFYSLHVNIIEFCVTNMFYLRVIISSAHSKTVRYLFVFCSCLCRSSVKCARQSGVQTFDTSFLHVFSFEQSIDQQTLFKIRITFVHQRPAPPPDVEYPLDGQKILHVKGFIRWTNTFTSSLNWDVLVSHIVFSC